MLRTIPYNKPVLKMAGINKIVKLFLVSPSLTKFKKSFNIYVKRKYTIFTNSGRTSLYLIFKSLKLKIEVLKDTNLCYLDLVDEYLSPFAETIPSDLIIYETEHLYIYKIPSKTT